jgi:hypothetical protein
MAELDELGVEDLVNAAQSRAQSSSLRAITSLDASPDDAAESIRLSDATGVPAPAINADLESFQNRVKQTTTASIVRNNPYISNYIASHPLAAQVANDDWAQLDTVSKASADG